MPTSWFILLPHCDWQVLGSWSYCFPSGISTSSAGSQVVLPVPDFPFFRSLFILQSTATLVILRSSFRMLLLCSKTVSGSMCPSTPVQTRLSGFSVSISGFILSCSLPLVPLPGHTLASLPFLLRASHAAHLLLCLGVFPVSQNAVNLPFSIAWPSLPIPAICDLLLWTSSKPNTVFCGSLFFTSASLTSPVALSVL